MWAHWRRQPITLSKRAAGSITQARIAKRDERRVMGCGRISLNFLRETDSAAQSG
ncbi:hypothetical protein SFHH103_psfHH103d_426 (plasmid) [Sinorhizobium fredii HH103]|nr:hypothetical protein SFHH103_04222 [Sinorhizobium fredii HH103]CEO91629.1 hypothetical protein SFHH103_psfHH103d_426 [Sinorhizobium fredii HH103]